MLATAAAATATAAMTLAAPVTALADSGSGWAGAPDQFDHRMKFNESVRIDTPRGSSDSRQLTNYGIATDVYGGSTLRIEFTNNSSFPLRFRAVTGEVYSHRSDGYSFYSPDGDMIFDDAIVSDYAWRLGEITLEAGKTGVLDVKRIATDLGKVTKKDGHVYAVVALVIFVTEVETSYKYPHSFTYKATWGGGVSMYRLYNPYSGEHHYTASTTERDALVKAGWRDEGVAWTAPASSKTPVYRLYNKYTGDHHYTMDKAERDACVRAGWNDEGIGWYSDDAKGVALRRGYNPYVSVGTHHYTTDASELKNMVAHGWHDEGTAWYGIK